MISKIARHLLKQINSTLSETVHDITQNHITVNVDEANQSLRLTVDNNESSILTTQTRTDPYQFLPTSLLTTDNITQSTMTRNIVSAFTVNEGDAFDKPHHTTMVAVLLGIFTCISITMSVSVFVFCRKKNSVFMLQKCEQDSDIDLEMNDMNTEVETSDSEYEFIESSSPQHGTRRSQTCPNLSKYGEDIDDSCQPLNSEKFNRRSLKKSKNLLTGSPTSTPLLNSTSHTCVQPSISDHQLSQRLSSNYTTNTGATAAKTSGKKYKHKIKHKHDNINKTGMKGTSESDSFLNKDKSYRQIKPGKYKYSNTKLPKGFPVRSSEYETVEIHADPTASYEKLYGEKQYDHARKCNETNTSILRMESIEDDNNIYISDAEVNILDHLEGKLELL